jgi:FMN phosphatase YigB (HAD superfamily)
MFKAIICDIQGVILQNGSVNKPLVNFFLKNREKYTKLIIYTNLSKEYIEELKEEIPRLFGIVDVCYPYNSLKYPKTDKRSFEQILQENDLKPHEVIFLDDNFANIQAAKGLGIQTIHYGEFGEVSTLKNLLFP